MNFLRYLDRFSRASSEILAGSGRASILSVRISVKINGLRRHFRQWTACAMLSLPLLAPHFVNGQTTIVNDTFIGRTSPDLSDGSALKGIPFFTNRASASLSLRNTPVSYLDTTRLHLVPFRGKRSIVGTLYNSRARSSRVRLGSPLGSKIELKFDFAFANRTGSGAGVSDWLNDSTVGDTTFSFGLFNSNGSITEANARPSSNNDRGYFGRIGVKDRMKAAIYKERGVRRGLISGADMTLLKGSYVAGAANNQIRHSVTCTLERTAATTVRFSFSVARGGVTIASGSASDSASPFSVFNEVVFGLGAGAKRHELEIDNVVLTTSTGSGLDPRLSWKPPVLSDPVTVTVSTDGTLKLLPGRDHIIKMPEKFSRNYGLSIAGMGARHIVIIGGEIDIPDAGPIIKDTSFSRKRRALVITNWTGTCHIEGLWIHGDDLAEGIDIDCRNPGAVLQVQNVRIDNVHSRPEEVAVSWENTHHPDMIQNWGGPYYYRIDRLTGYSEYQGLMMQPNQFGENPVQLADFRNMDLHYLNSEAGGKYMIFYTSGVVKWNLNNVWLEPRPANAWTGAVYPNNSPLFEKAHRGSPPGGNFVPAGVPGGDYVSPGYL